MREHVAPSPRPAQCHRRQHRPAEQPAQAQPWEAGHSRGKQAGSQEGFVGDPLVLQSRRGDSDVVTPRADGQFYGSPFTRFWVF